MGAVGQGTVVRRKNKVVFHALIFLFSAIILTIAVRFAVFIVQEKISNGVSISAVKKKWKVYDYEAVKWISEQILEKDPFNNAALIYNGYASFFLALSQIDAVLAQELIDSAIRRLRLSLLDANPSAIPQISYMLGKSYYYKNVFSSYHYYADLAVRFLIDAQRMGYKNEIDDTAEYLGLSYASLGMAQQSLSALTTALLERETDYLLLAIAEQYVKIAFLDKKPDQAALRSAEQYLHRIKTDCKDEEIVLKSRLLLSEILFAREEFDEALKEIQFVLETDDSNADAYCKAGEIYEKLGDFAKARAQWRKALKIQPSHQVALKKMADYR